MSLSLPPPRPLPSPAFAADLGRWYDSAARPLPWRRKPSVYGTVVSELMCQQTQVATVIPYYERWLARWPSFGALAAAAESDVLNAWEGLGYYSRARRLQALAREIATRGELPRTAAQWRELPGIGPYTAAAIASITFGEAAAVVDGNVVRVLARLSADATLHRDGPAAAQALRPLAEQLLDHREPGRHNQAMMELGALVCRPRAPQCPICPVRSHCAAAKAGDPMAYPQLARKAMREASVTRACIMRDHHILLHVASGAARRLAHLAELPTPEQAGVDTTGWTVLAKRRRTIAQTRYTETLAIPPGGSQPASEAGPAATGCGRLAWAELPELRGFTLSAPHRRWIAEFFGETAKTRKKTTGFSEPGANGGISPDPN